MATHELHQAVGRRHTLRLSQRLGGKFVYVPQRPSPDSILATVLPQNAQQALSDYAGGSRIYIPCGPAKRERHRLMRAMAPHYSARQIARALGVSLRTVRHIRRQEVIDQQLSERAENDRDKQRAP